MVPFRNNIQLGLHMLTNQDKIDIVNNKINGLDAVIQSYIDHAEEFSDKYSLEEVLPDCNAQKAVLLEILESLGGTRS